MKIEIQHVIADLDIAEHSGTVPLELSDDGAKLYTVYTPEGQKRKKLYVFDTDTAELISEFATRMEGGSHLTVAPDGSGVIVHGSSLKYINIDTGEAAKVRKRGDHACFTSDGQTIFCSDGKSLYRYSVADMSKLGAEKFGRDEFDGLRRTDDALVGARVDGSYSYEINAFEYDGEFILIDESSGAIEELKGLPSIELATDWDVHGDRIAIRHQGDDVLRVYTLEGEQIAEIETPTDREFRSCRSLLFVDSDTVITLDLVGGEDPSEVWSHERYVRLWGLGDGSVDEFHLEHEVAQNSSMIAVVGDRIAIGDSPQGILIGDLVR